MQLLEEITDLKISLCEIQSQGLDKKKILAAVSEQVNQKVKSLESRHPRSLGEWKCGLAKIMDHLARVETKVEAIDARTSPMRDHLEQYHVDKALSQRKMQIEREMNPRAEERP